jgi:hypothetical protein
MYCYYEVTNYQPLLIPILNLEQGLAIRDGELGTHRTGVKNRPVHHDVMVVHLLQDAPIFKAPVKCLMARPRCTLHPKVLHWVSVIVGVLNLIGVPHIAIVGLNALARLQAVG